MNQSIIKIVLLISSTLGAVSFFLPWVDADLFGHLSGYSLVYYGLKWEKLASLLLLIYPVVCLIHLFMLVLKKNLLIKVVSGMIPFVLMFFSVVFFFLYFEFKFVNLFQHLSDISSVLLYGFYLMLISSLISFALSVWSWRVR
jgi:hypothetical protein